MSIILLQLIKRAPLRNDPLPEILPKDLFDSSRNFSAILRKWWKFSWMRVGVSKWNLNMIYIQFGGITWNSWFLLFLPPPPLCIRNNLKLLGLRLPCLSLAPVKINGLYNWSLRTKIILQQQKRLIETKYKSSTQGTSNLQSFLANYQQDLTSSCQRQIERQTDRDTERDRKRLLKLLNIRKIVVCSAITFILFQSLSDSVVPVELSQRSPRTTLINSPQISNPAQNAHRTNYPIAVVTYSFTSTCICIYFITVSYYYYYLPVPCSISSAPTLYTHEGGDTKRGARKSAPQ